LLQTTVTSPRSNYYHELIDLLIYFTLL